MTDKLQEIFGDIVVERHRQDAKGGINQDHSPGKWLAILMKEAGEAAKTLLEGKQLNWREELVQVAAVAVAAIEACDNGEWGWPSPP